MKKTTVPPIRVEPDFRAEVDAVLAEGETLTQFVEASVRASVERRRMQAEFVARGLRSREEARRTEDYVDADAVDPLIDFLLELELSRDGGDLSVPKQAIAALQSGMATLKSSPFTCRKAGQSPFLRELIVPFGRSGHVAFFEIEGEGNVAGLAVRHQLEDDDH